MKNERVDACAYCGTGLATVDEIHVIEGQHYCSKECAVSAQEDVIRNSARDMALEWYNDCSEIVTPVDIGIVYEKVWTTYSKEGDITTILKSRYLDKEMTETVSTEVLGFYWGTPNDEDTETYIGQLKATY